MIYDGTDVNMQPHPSVGTLELLVDIPDGQNRHLDVPVIVNGTEGEPFKVEAWSTSATYSEDDEGEDDELKEDGQEREREREELLMYENDDESELGSEKEIERQYCDNYNKDKHESEVRDKDGGTIQQWWQW